MKLNILYSKDIASQVIFSTIKEKKWLDKNGYSYLLPKLSGLKERDEIRRIVEEDYNEYFYDKIAKLIRRQWDKNRHSFVSAVKSVFSDKYRKEYKVILTKFGIMGSYELPNKICINVALQKRKELMKTIYHEIIHLIIEDKIIKYKIPHIVKERIVDLILNDKRFKLINYSYWQDSYGGCEEIVDKLFHEHFFTNQEKFFEELSNKTK